MNFKLSNIFSIIANNTFGVFGIIYGAVNFKDVVSNHTTIFIYCILIGVSVFTFLISVLLVHYRNSYLVSLSYAAEAITNYDNTIELSKTECEMLAKRNNKLEIENELLRKELEKNSLLARESEVDIVENN